MGNLAPVCQTAASAPRRLRGDHAPPAPDARKIQYFEVTKFIAAPAIGVAAGSIAGAVMNFVSSKYWIFRAPGPRRA